MTYAELQTRLARYLGNASLADDPTYNTWAGDAINQAHLELARGLRLPRGYSTLSVTTGTVTIPDTLQTDGLLYVSDATNANPLPILYPEKIASKMPDRTSLPAGIPKVVEYDPFNPSQFKLWPPPAATTTLDVIYAKNPATLSASTDTPWDNQLPEFHDVIALRAALLVFEGDWPDTERIAWVRNRYEEQFTQAKEFLKAGRNPHSNRPGEVKAYDATAAKR